MNTIANERRNGKSIAFVWFDIKNLDWCDPIDPKWQHCSVHGLRDLARQILQPADIRVMYRYIVKANSETYPFIRDGLNNNEAINLDGDLKKALQLFESGGPTDQTRRVSSYGDTDLSHEFGNCQEGQYYTCTELRQAVASGKFGRVFGWTSTIGQGGYVHKELDIAGVDGIIYGFGGADYKDAVELVPLLRTSLTGYRLIQIVASSLPITIRPGDSNSTCRQYFEIWLRLLKRDSCSNQTIAGTRTVKTF